jgi:GNAT superfamily N-acetyltransferase
MTSAVVRASAPRDFPEILALLKRKAEFDGGLALITATDAEIEAAIFGASPKCEVLVAERTGRVVAFASYFSTFSTFLAASCLWLDDLFVDPDERSRGIGASLLSGLAALALERDCARLEWTVSASNDRGIKFYERCGAQIRTASRLARLDRSALESLASGRASDTEQAVAADVLTLCRQEPW